MIDTFFSPYLIAPLSYLQKTSGELCLDLLLIFMFELLSTSGITQLCKVSATYAKLLKTPAAPNVNHIQKTVHERKTKKGLPCQ